MEAKSQKHVTTLLFEEPQKSFSKDIQKYLRYTHILKILACIKGKWLFLGKKKYFLRFLMQKNMRDNWITLQMINSKKNGSRHYTAFSDKYKQIRKKMDWWVELTTMKIIFFLSYGYESLNSAHCHKHQEKTKEFLPGPFKFYLNLCWGSKSPVVAWPMSPWKNLCEAFPNMKTYPFADELGEKNTILRSCFKNHDLKIK